MKKVLLLNPPASRLYVRDNYCSFTSKADYYWPPIDLLVLSGLLKEELDVHVLDCTIENFETEYCVKYIHDHEIENLIFLTGTASWKEDSAAVAQIHAETAVKRIFAIGGNLLTEHAKYFDEYPFIHGVITNYAFNNVSRLISEDYEPEHLVNIVMPGKHDPPPSAIQKKRFFYPVPLHEKFPLAKYRNPLVKSHPFASVLTSYGCPYACSFCIGSILDYAQRDIDNFCCEIDTLAHLGINEIMVCDFTFNIGKEHPRNICDAIIENRFDIGWFCQCRCDNVSEDLVVMLKDAGCHTVTLGVESADKDILDRYHKDLTLQKIEDSFRLFKKHKVRTLGYFMIGLPGETEESIKNTIAFAKKLDCDFASFSIATPDIGTSLMSECIEKNWIDKNLDTFDSTFDAVIESSDLSKEKIIKLRNRAVKAFYLRPGYVLAKLADAHSLHDLKNLAANGSKLFFNLFK